jgi:hypothetical protein
MSPLVPRVILWADGLLIWGIQVVFVDYFDFNESSDYRTSDTHGTDENGFGAGGALSSE